jgi:hypothetical protein
MAKYSDLICNSRTENSPIRSVCLDPIESYNSEDGVITYMADWTTSAAFTGNATCDGDIVDYTPFWPRNSRWPEGFTDISGALTEDGIVTGFELYWTGYPLA